MKVEVKRTYNENATLGELFVNGIYLCDTLEPSKTQGKGPIPEGTYPIVFRKTGTHHEKYSKRFPDTHVGMLHITNVPNFKYILIHIGNYTRDTSGCLLVGKKMPEADHIVQMSEKTYLGIYSVISMALGFGEEVNITYSEMVR